MFWLEIILWPFGSGKSLYTHASLVTQINRYKRKKKPYIAIANYSSPDVTIQFRSIEDFVFILTAIYFWKMDRKNLAVPVIIVVDEAPIYFGNREFASFPRQLLSFLVQLRKLNCHIQVIAQDLKMLDINFRRLCYNVKKYFTSFGIVRFHRNYELLSEDANIGDPLNTIESARSWHFWPFFYSTFWKYCLSYDTYELIIPDQNIVEIEKLKEIFPWYNGQTLGFWAKKLFKKSSWKDEKFVDDKGI